MYPNTAHQLIWSGKKRHMILHKTVTCHLGIPKKVGLNKSMTLIESAKLYVLRMSMLHEYLFYYYDLREA